jgi:YD repeat-containing protein
MLNKIVGAVFVIVLLQCCLTTRAQGQTGSLCIGHVECGTYNIQDPVCIPPIPAGAFGCLTPYGWTTYCFVLVPCGSPPAWCPTCNKGSGTAGSPINLTNGNTFIQEPDIEVPGLGGGFSLVRTWNSVVPTIEQPFASGMFGLQWRSSYEERVFQGTGEATGFMTYLRGDGGIWYFSSSGSLSAPGNLKATLTQNGTTSWTITFQNGEKRIFSYATGALISIVDPNGNTMTFTYDASNRLTAVTDAVSRHLYFSYANGSSLLVTGITSDIGITTSYTYDSQSRLIQVTEPDSTTLSFQYNSQSLISKVSDSNGTTLETHTYDANGRGLTSSRANGVDAVTVTYP